jgi:bacillithiol system protein YtxJ
MNKMVWQHLTSPEQLQMLKESSKQNPVLIFKHSTRCSISRAALDRLQRNWKQEEMKSVTPFYLDLLKYPEVSSQVSDDFEIQHESPQVLLIRDGKSVYDRSHLGIDYRDIAATATKNDHVKN